MEPTVIVLRGPQGCGKTTTLNLVWEDLLNHPDVTEHWERRRRPGGDYYNEIRGDGILLINDVRVGFITMAEGALAAYVQRLLEEGCQVIVLANRSFGGSWEVVQTLATIGWNVIPFQQVWNLPGQQAQANQEMADQIVAAVFQAVGLTAEEAVGV